MKKSFIFVMVGFVVAVCLPVSSASGGDFSLDKTGLMR